MGRNFTNIIHVMSAGAFFLVGCVSQEKFPVTEKTVLPGSEITWLGERAPLSSEARLQIGDTFPQVKLVDTSMKDGSLLTVGEVTVISVIPSIDTPVCEVQTHTLGETKELDPRVRKVTVSADLPYAQRRFAQEAKLENIAYFSDYRSGTFGKLTGLKILRNELLARAIIVVDKKGKVRHLQVVPEITNMPDLEKAFRVANALVKE